MHFGEKGVRHIRTRVEVKNCSSFGHGLTASDWLGLHFRRFSNDLQTLFWLSHVHLEVSTDVMSLLCQELHDLKWDVPFDAEEDRKSIDQKDQQPLQIGLFRKFAPGVAGSHQGKQNCPGCGWHGMTFPNRAWTTWKRCGQWGRWRWSQSFH